MATKQHDIHIRFTEHTDKRQIESPGKELLEAAQIALSQSYSPYSGFRVAAAILLDNGKTITGANQENSAYPSGLCAERVAVFAAKAQFPKAEIIAIAVTAQSDVATDTSPITPCGACRQVLLEYEKIQNGNIGVWLTANCDEVLELSSVKDLLPLHFFKTSLKKG